MMKVMRTLPFSTAWLVFLSLGNPFASLVDGASVILTNSCFNIGDTIDVRFNEVSGEGIFIGLYPDNEVPNKQALPALDSPSLREWILTCGEKTNCESWVDSGIVQLPTNALDPGTYFIAISGNRSGLTPQGTSVSFQVGLCPDANGDADVNSFFSVPSPVPPSAVNRPIVFGPTQTIDTFTRNPTPRPTPVPTPAPQDTVLVVTNDIQSTIDDARRQIENLIRNDGDLTGKFLRLVFHDCIGGCDGCVDMANPDNAGLDKPISRLESIVDSFASRGMTRTDIWMLSGMVATETALPPGDRDIRFDLQWVGRRTCEAMQDCGVDFSGNPSTCTAMRGPHVGQAHAVMGTRSVQSFFEQEFNFSPQQVTALMGAHSVGRMSRENSGFMGRWDLSATSFDGGYWIELVGQPPNFFLEDVINGDLPGMPNRRQWRGVVNPGSLVTMLHTDIALVRNIEDMRDGQVNCEFIGPNSCSHDTPFMPHAQRYVRDNRAWLFDFREVFSILVDHGHEKAADCPIGRICTFGSHREGTLSTQTVEGIRHQSQSSSNGGGREQGVNGARISLDKVCYTPGERIVAEYSNISGENVWIGILAGDDVPNFQDLPASPSFRSESIKRWKLSCGNEECHTWTSVGGLQFDTNGLENGEYIVVVSGNNGSREGQAASTFLVGGC